MPESQEGLKQIFADLLHCHILDRTRISRRVETRRRPSASTRPSLPESQEGLKPDTDVGVAGVGGTAHPESQEGLKQVDYVVELAQNDFRRPESQEGLKLHTQIGANTRIVARISRRVETISFSAQSRSPSRMASSRISRRVETIQHKAHKWNTCK